MHYSADIQYVYRYESLIIGKIYIMSKYDYISFYESYSVQQYNELKGKSSGFHFEKLHLSEFTSSVAVLETVNAGIFWPDPV